MLVCYVGSVAHPFRHDVGREFVAQFSLWAVLALYIVMGAQTGKMGTENLKPPKIIQFPRGAC
jgi:hypothetical protein